MNSRSHASIHTHAWLYDRCAQHFKTPDQAADKKAAEEAAAKEKVCGWVGVCVCVCVCVCKLVRK